MQRRAPQGRGGAEADSPLCRRARIRFLTIFSLSSEDGSRPDGEVEGPFSPVRIFIRSDLADLNRNGVKVRVIGERHSLPSDIRGLIEDAETLTAGNPGLQLIAAFSYGVRDEMVRAARRLAARVAAGHLAPEAIDQWAFEQALDTSGLPDPDLIIRTSGEQRISNFLLWQAAYAELIFLPVLWPDFDDCQFEQALVEFMARNRRYGGVAAV